MLNQLFNMANRERIMNDNPCRLVSRTVLKALPSWQNRERWLNKYSAAACRQTLNNQTVFGSKRRVQVRVRDSSAAGKGHSEFIGDLLPSF